MPGLVTEYNHVQFIIFFIFGFVVKMSFFQPVFLDIEETYH